ncbi:hypothetical protein [Calidifontibacillus erzurumensis]|uniref:Uncharacterized protein n=1 Tax=Calidifontibacillus erzurumensis TaxID=2741433 RepID=A0A8J8GF18_9BACI|nr:hypothetical protein [Calidifontibacillus erzurumensis]NSL52304.1 hypothetical protein [Calidifontibacillus erzurumensis]
MKRLFLIITVAAIVLSLTGCLYPEERRAENRIPYKDQINMVQNAIDQYIQNEGGLLPIKTKESSTPIFQKYPVDFNKLIPRYLPEPPGSAYESGGIFQYVLTYVETDPTVKLIDLTLVETIRDINMRIHFYRERHGYPPYKEPVDQESGYFTLDYQKLGYEQVPFVKSPYSGKNLSLFIDTNGEIFVDYRPDLYEALNTFKHDYKHGDDIRYLLVDNYDFVPVFSVPYTVKNNDPIFLTE